MAGKRTYGDACGMARALDILGERWALLIVRELLLGPKRFTDLRSGLPNLSPDVLTQRLRDLEQGEVVARRKLDPPASSWVYELTERGRDLEPLLVELGRWGSTAPFPDGGAPLGVDSTILAFESLYAPAAPERAGTFEVRLDGQAFTVRVGDGRADVARGPATDPEASIATDPATLAALLWQGSELATAEKSGAAEVTGDRRAAKRFLSLFPLPAR